MAGSVKKGKDVEGLVFEKAKRDESESSPEKEEAKGENLVVDDAHRSTAIELFENYFARAYRRKDNAPMTRKEQQYTYLILTFKRSITGHPVTIY